MYFPSYKQVDMAVTLPHRYQLVQELVRRGNMEVVRAIDREEQRPVIIRSFAVSSEADLDAYLRFQQEGAILRSLKHPNICETYRTFMEEGVGYIVIEQVEGTSLGALLAQHRLTLEQVRWLAAQVAAGLAYSHSMTIIHRDLNPENIMIDRQGTAKMRFMSEYGMARLLKSGSLESRVSKLAGPPTYQAPEQIAGEPADHRVDIYSLGAVMYHMVTGQPPFPGQDALAVARAVATETPPAPSEVVWGLPNDWDTLIRRAMHRHPDARFPTAVAMEVAIRALPAPGSVPQAMESAEEREEAPVQEEPAITCFNCGQVSRGRFCPNCGTRLVHP